MRKCLLRRAFAIVLTAAVCFTSLPITMLAAETSAEHFDSGTQKEAAEPEPGGFSDGTGEGNGTGGKGTEAGENAEREAADDYLAEGTITWKEGKDDALHPEMEAYFKNCFTIFRNSDTEAYTAFQVHYEQDEEDADCWKYRLYGLLRETGQENAEAASYTLIPAEVEGYQVSMENTLVDKDSTELDIVYTRGEEKKQPEDTEASETAEESKKAEASEVTEVSEEAEASEETEVPEEAEKPEVPGETNAPGLTEVPEPTEAPEVTEAPEPTEEPEVTGAPEPTEEPEVTGAPEPTEEPEITKAPEPTEESEITKAPELTEASTVTDVTEEAEVSEVTEVPEEEGLSEEEEIFQSELVTEDMEVQTFAAEPEPVEKTITIGGLSVTYSDSDAKENLLKQDVYWVDGNDKLNERPEAAKFLRDYLARDTEPGTAGIEVTVTRADGTTVQQKLTFEEFKTQFPNANIICEDEGGTGHYVLSTSGTLPSKGTVTGANGKKEEVTLSYRFAEDKYSVPEYKSQNVTNWEEYSDLELEPGWYYQVGTDFQITLKLYDGKKLTDQMKQSLKQTVLDQFYLYFKRNEKAGTAYEKESLTALDKLSNLVEVTVDVENNTITVTIPNCAVYSLEGYEKVYYIDVERQDEGALKIPVGQDEDWLEISYDNSAVPNFGDKSGEAYNGGEAKLTLAGNTEYNATKKWLDAGRPENSTRPELTFQLWRYTKKDAAADFKNAAPVKNEAGELLELVVPGNTAGNGFAIDFSSANAIAGEGSVLLADGEFLPKYDSEGYEYIYFAREAMGAAPDGLTYTREYGTVDGNGNVTGDTLPYDGDRQSIDSSIYNGGAINNRLTGTVTAEGKKTWLAADFQDEFADVRVEFTLQSPVQDESGATVWKAVQGSDGAVIKEVLDGFQAESLTREFSQTMPKYDGLGKEIQYRWAETGVYQGESLNLLDTEKGTFTLTQNGHEVLYRSENISVTEGRTEIVNRIADTVGYEVEKKWEGKNGELIDTPPEGTLTKDLTVNLYREDYTGKIELVGGNLPLWIIDETTEFPVEGTFKVKDGENKFVTVNYHINENENGKLVVENELPRYDVGGHRYEYMVYENPVVGYYPSYKTIFDESRDIYQTVITNAPGDGQVIRVRKRWIDDSDNQHRGEVAFTVYKRTGENAFTQIDEPVIVTQADFWWKEVGIPKEINLKDILVLETGITSGETEVMETITYSREQMEWIYQKYYNGTSPEPEFKDVITSEHHYRQDWGIENINGEDFYTITNRRVGEITLEATKTWVDGSDKRADLIKALKEKGYGLYLKVTCEEEPGAVRDNGTIALNGLESVEITGGTIQELTGENAKETKTFAGLPKYNQYGAVVHYSITEVVGKQDDKGKVTTEQKSLSEAVAEGIVATDFSMNIRQESYTVGPAHTNDTQEVAVTNSLGGTKDITFYKQWKDAYRYGKGERPDISLDIYQMTHDENGNKVVKSYYKDYTWNPENEEKSRWSITIPNLPKYDEYGYEIFYYAKERMSVTGGNFHYLPVYYMFTIDDKETEVGSEAGPKQEPGTNTITETDYMVQEKKEAPWLLKENGIFVNQLEDSVTVEGKKLWKQVPSGYTAVNLPAVKFKLMQKLSGSETEATEVASLTINDWSKQLVDGNYIFQMKYLRENTNTVNTVQDGELVVGVPEGTEKTPIPRYDEDGNLYEYELKEVYKDATVAGNVYTQPEVNGYLVSNTYDSIRGSLTVEKQIKDRELTGQEKYPSVTFTLTRAYNVKTEDGKKVLTEDKAFVKTLTISREALETGRGTAQGTFENLQIYAYNGERFEYTVTETGIDGYLASYKITPLTEGSEVKEETAEAAGKDLAAPGILPVKDTQPEPPVTGESKMPQVVFENQYQPEVVSLEGKKIWEDNKNAGAVRPEITVEGTAPEETRTVDGLNLEVYRKAAAEPGGNNSIPNQKLTENTDFIVTWISGTATSDEWSYKIQGVDNRELERYAPNGMEWEYTVKEVMNNPYNNIYQATPVNGIVSVKEKTIA